MLSFQATLFGDSACCQWRMFEKIEILLVDALNLTAFSLYPRLTTVINSTLEPQIHTFNIEALRTQNSSR